MAHFNDDQAREIIRETYGHLSSHGPAVAEAFYAPEELAELPSGAVEFALGVANPVRHANLRPGENVLDLGCGAAIDTLLAARAVGSTGTAIGVDMTPEMVARARANAASAGLSNVESRQGLIEELPLFDESVDVVISAPVQIPALKYHGGCGVLWPRSGGQNSRPDCRRRRRSAC